MSRSEASRRALLESGFGADPDALAPHDRAALEKVAGAPSRLALHGSAWLQLRFAGAGCVLDFSGLESDRDRGREGMTRSPVDERVATIERIVREQAREHLAADRIL